MILGGLQIQPISVRLIEENWEQRYDDACKYFSSIGINDILWITGIHAERAGLEASRAYARDAPNIETGWRIPPRTVGCGLSWYTAFSVMQHREDVGWWMILEDDTRFHEDWEERLHQAILDAPSDFDYLIASHCCCEGRETAHIKGDVYEVKYPQAPHCAIVSHKCLKTVIENTKDFCVPFDVNLFDVVFPMLKVYTVLPRIAEQVKTHLPK